MVTASLKLITMLPSKAKSSALLAGLKPVMHDVSKTYAPVNQHEPKMISSWNDEERACTS